MDLDGGKASVRALEKAGNNDASVHVVAKAGHHVYLDNPDDTNKIIGDAIRAVKW
jgi:cardiolipin-specific phospholipase